MLREYNHPGTPDGDLLKRWFSDEFFDLFVWYDDKHVIVSFQLCYNKPRDEHSLTWRIPSSYYHQRVDDGESHPGKNKSTPILLPDGAVDSRALSTRFKMESEHIDKEVSSFVEGKLEEFANRAVA
jgi:hypothetical protein